MLGAAVVDHGSRARGRGIGLIACELELGFTGLIACVGVWLGYGQLWNGGDEVCEHLHGESMCGESNESLNTDQVQI